MRNSPGIVSMSTSTGPSRHLLLIEPSAGESSRILRAIEAAGLSARAFADLAAAEASARMDPPGLILARWDLVSADFDAIARLSGGPTTGWVPLIVHGARDAADRARAIDRGALDAMDGLPDGDELRARLAGALRLRDRFDRIERRAYRDALTGLINRAALDDQLHRHWEAARRHGTSLSVLIVDLDRFKQINDAHGHPAGDAALRRTADVLSRSVRSSDLVARYGGDEFVVVAPSCAPAAAAMLAARFRAGIAGPTGRIPPITLSIGIAGTDGPKPPGLAELIHRADAALYLAKRSGRDAVAMFDPGRGAPTLLAGLRPDRPPR